MPECPTCHGKPLVECRKCGLRHATRTDPDRLHCACGGTFRPITCPNHEPEGVTP